MVFMLRKSFLILREVKHTTTFPFWLIKKKKKKSLHIFRFNSLIYLEFGAFISPRLLFISFQILLDRINHSVCCPGARHVRNYVYVIANAHYNPVKEVILPILS